ncbi:hypothetical protein BpHYR1_007020 [Brachionus plicatilis]|uniref:Uncharacterized protein n=1 Tax=Brachionus plicatilis TaxID=10195 RepID=A0A3M7PLG2_BRAPC|nr:hypothetical protein BpHYR1_007020 [Brachionus plicatilis]
MNCSFLDGLFCVLAAQRLSSKHSSITFSLNKAQLFYYVSYSLCLDIIYTHKQVLFDGLFAKINSTINIKNI